MAKQKKTTIYLPEELKREIERRAKRRDCSEADVIRDAVCELFEREPPPVPTLPLGAFTLGGPDVAERAEELLDEGFGR